MGDILSRLLYFKKILGETKHFLNISSSVGSLICGWELTIWWTWLTPGWSPFFKVNHNFLRTVMFPLEKLQKDDWRWLSGDPLASAICARMDGEGEWWVDFSKFRRPPEVLKMMEWMKFTEHNINQLRLHSPGTSCPVTAAFPGKWDSATLSSFSLVPLLLQPPATISLLSLSLVCVC